MPVYYFSCVQPSLSIISYIVYCIQWWLYNRDYECTVLCLYKHNICITKALQYFSILSFFVSKLLSLKALDPIMSSVANTNHKNDLPTNVSIRLDRDNYLLWKSLVLPLIRTLQTWWLQTRNKKNAHSCLSLQVTKLRKPILTMKSGLHMIKLS